MRLWGIILTLTLASFIGVLLSRDPGYTLFSYGNTTIEMPLWVAFILIGGFIAICTLSILLLASIVNSSRTIRYWWQKHRKATARLQTYQGLLELMEGHWQKAERHLIKSALLSDTPLINYLSAAKAAEESDSPKRRDTYLQLAFEASGRFDMAVRLTQAQLQLKRGELESSVENIEKLYQKAPKNPKVLKLLCTLYQAQNNWQGLYNLLPILSKEAIFSSHELQQLEEKIYTALIPLYAARGLKPLIQLWRNASKTILTNTNLIAHYAYALLNLSAYEEAEEILEKSLKKTWDNTLIQVYGLVKSQHPKHQLNFAENFLPLHPDNPWLLQCLGRLCLNHQLWGKAKDYFEQSLIFKPEPEIYAELGRLMDYLGMGDKSDEYFKKGLLLATENKVIPWNIQINNPEQKLIEQQ